MTDKMISRPGTLALLLCGAVLSALPALAQQDAGGPPPPPPAGEQGPGMHRGPGGPGARMHEELKQLNLSADQEKQVHAIMESERPKMDALRDNSSMDQADRRKEMMKIHEDATSKIRAVLTEDQKKKFDELQKQDREHMRAGRGRRGGMGEGDGSVPPPPPPPPPPQQ